MAVDVFVGAGSNIEPRTHLRLGVDLLTKAFHQPRLSSVYQSPPVGFDGDDFLNMVLTFSTLEPVDHVLTTIEGIHQRAGRRRQDKLASRTLDLDLLSYGQRVDGPARLPREDLRSYGFVLKPMAELAPGWLHPITGETMADAWARFQCQHRLTKLGPL